MNTRLLGLLSISVCLLLASPARSGQAPTPADIAKLVAEAATCEPGQSREPFRRLEELVRQPSPGVRKHLEAGLVRLLAPASTFEARRFACKQLGMIGSHRALPALGDLLKSEETTGIACLALTTYPPGKADEILRAALPSARGTARIQIINTLGDRRDAKAVKLLAQLAGDADSSVARAAVASLGKVGNQAAWKAIASFPKDADPALQLALTEATLRCADALARSGDRKTATPIYEQLLAPSQPAYVRRAALDALFRLDRDQGQQRILQVLHGSDAALTPVAIAAVRALPSGKASETFLAELPNLQPQEQVWMIDSLAVRGDAAACYALSLSLASPDAAVRRAAINAMGRMGDAWAAWFLLRALSRAQDLEERRAIQSALISLRGGEITDCAIIAALKESAGNTRADLIPALARRQGPAANTLLLAEAGQTDPAVAKAALRALAKTAGGKEITPLLERLTSTRDAEVRAEAENAAAQAIARIDKPARRSVLVREALGWAQSVESRNALLGLLPACGDAPALTALKAATTDADSRVRDAAVRALADWPDPSAWDALAAIYRQPGTEALRGVALRGLGAEAEVAVKKIAEAIKAQHPKAAQEALKRLQSKPKAE